MSQSSFEMLIKLQFLFLKNIQIHTCLIESELFSEGIYASVEICPIRTATTEMSSAFSSVQLRRKPLPSRLPYLENVARMKYWLSSTAKLSLHPAPSTLNSTVRDTKIMSYCNNIAGVFGT